MRKLVFAIAAAAVIATVGALGALAASSWPSVTESNIITPNKAGTPKHPQGVVLKATLNWQTLGASNQPIVTKFFATFPKGSLFNGAKYPTCSLTKLNSSGPTACPSGSIMGHGTGDAYADTVITHPQITVINGGATKIYFYTVLNNPARVQQPVIGYLTKTSGKWAYTLSVSVPEDLQIVAGVPIELTHLVVTAGKAGSTWIATTACGPGHKWPYSITTSYKDPNTNATGSSTYNGSDACR
jgi:hypothetical protein